MAEKSQPNSANNAQEGSRFKKTGGYVFPRGNELGLPDIEPKNSIISESQEFDSDSVSSGSDDDEIIPDKKRAKSMCVQQMLQKKKGGHSSEILSLIFDTDYSNPKQAKARKNSYYDKRYETVINTPKYKLIYNKYSDLPLAGPQDFTHMINLADEPESAQVGYKFGKQNNDTSSAFKPKEKTNIRSARI